MSIELVEPPEGGAVGIQVPPPNVHEGEPRTSVLLVTLDDVYVGEVRAKLFWDTNERLWRKLYTFYPSPKVSIGTVSEHSAQVTALPTIHVEDYDLERLSVTIGELFGV